MPLITGIFTEAGVELQEVENWGGPVTSEADTTLIPMVQYYKHFDLSDEELGRTHRYNCWGFTFLPRRYWINSSDDVDQILNDNCVPVSGSWLPLRPGDVIRYRDSYGVTTHTGRVWEVDGSGNCVKVRSKWGSWAEYVHAPDDYHIYDDDVYGTNLAYFRQLHPLKGIIGDLWIMDEGDDNGEQCSNSQWGSPDILVDAPPFGSVDVNPAFLVGNHVWTIVHNRSQANIDNVHVYYFWADPNAGFAPSQWHPIPGGANPNPTASFSVPGYSYVEAPYVDWTPVPVAGVPDPAHQCLLAVAYVNDDPQDSGNPNPIVYPFDIRWDNNIAARNVHIIYLKKGAKAKVNLKFGLPFDSVEKLDATLRVRLNYVPRLSIFGYPAKMVLPEVRIKVGEQGIISLVKVKAAKMPARSAKLREMTVAQAEIKRLQLVRKKAVPIAVEIAAPATAQSNSNFYLRIEQLVNGTTTGCYTVVISII